MAERTDPQRIGLTTWRSLWREAAGLLGSEAEARWLVEEASGSAWPAVLSEEPTARSAAWLEDALRRRAGGEPLQYILGHWSFRGLELAVDQRVLIPRPETELVVEVALGELDARAGQVGDGPAGGAPLLAADLGTGSGAIALALASERPGLEVWATDVSPEALEVATANLAALATVAGRVHLSEGSWWDALPDHLRGKLDLVVSNPPYVGAEESCSLPDSVRLSEPQGALVAGPKGTEAIDEILDGAAGWLAPGASIVMEIAPHQAEEALALAERSGIVGGRVDLDLAGRPRALVARRASAAPGALRTGNAATPPDAGHDPAAGGLGCP